MLTSEVLNKAADEIETRGWTTGGGGGDAWDVGGTSPVCLEGGIIAASGIHGAGRKLLAACPAARAVHAYLGLRADMPLWEWNDAYNVVNWTYMRTQAEVIEVLRAAAAIEQAREAQPAVVTA